MMVRKSGTTVTIFLAVIGLFWAGVLISRNHQQAIRERLAVIRPQPPFVGPPDFHRQMVNSDEAFKAIGDRTAQEAEKNFHSRFSVPEKIRRSDAVAKAADAELARCRPSHFERRFAVDAFYRDANRRITAK